MSWEHVWEVVVGYAIGRTIFDTMRVAVARFFAA